MDDQDSSMNDIKLLVNNTSQTKPNGKKSICSATANFQCGLPASIKENNADFSLFKSRKDKSMLMLVEDTQNEVLYFDKCLPSQQTRMIGVFDPESNNINLIPITYSFNMKSEKINRKDIMDIDQDDDLVDTFGSKFAVKNMNKKRRLKKTKEATFAAMDRMNTAQLINDDQNDNNNNNNNNKTPKEKQNRNIFCDYEFSKSPYCLFEFPFNQNAKKISSIYNLEEIVPCYIWNNLESECNEFETVFVKRCLNFREQIKEKKGEDKYKLWMKKLVLYDICIRFLKSIDNRPFYIQKYLWQNMKSAFLEQYQSEMRKPIKYSMTRRSKMRIVGIVLLVALNIAFWKISVEACKDIAKDLHIPFRVIVAIYGLLGCSNRNKIVSLNKLRKGKIYKRNPKTSIDGIWWNV